MGGWGGGGGGYRTKCEGIAFFPVNSSKAKGSLYKKHIIVLAFKRNPDEPMEYLSKT